MTARMMPGGPVAEAVFAELQGRIEKLIDRPHARASARCSSAATRLAPATSA